MIRNPLFLPLAGETKLIVNLKEIIATYDGWPSRVQPHNIVTIAECDLYWTLLYNRRLLLQLTSEPRTTPSTHQQMVKLIVLWDNMFSKLVGEGLQPVKYFDILLTH